MNLLHALSRLVGDDSPLWPIITGCGLLLVALYPILAGLWLVGVIS